MNDSKKIQVPRDRDNEYSSELKAKFDQMDKEMSGTWRLDAILGAFLAIVAIAWTCRFIYALIQYLQK